MSRKHRSPVVDKPWARLAEDKPCDQTNGVVDFGAERKHDDEDVEGDLLVASNMVDVGFFGGGFSPWSTAVTA